jgi:uncharacterized repeat protein (TIGR03803 family)
LVQATDGSLYGTTLLGGSGGANLAGTIFKITLAGTLTTLYNFCSKTGCTDGYSPSGALVQATSGDFYGVTSVGGANVSPYGGVGAGTIFKITPGGTLTTLYSFCSKTGCTDGYYPSAALIQAADGDFYGVTSVGGVGLNPVGYGPGTIFKVTPGGTLTTLYSFCSKTGCADGDYPLAALLQTANGDLYGTTAYGGAYNGGTVFKITPSGTLTTLYSFCAKSNCADGEAPTGWLAQGPKGDLYGTTYYGGSNDSCYHGCGTVFKTTSGGNLTTLYSFCALAGCTDGTTPNGGLVQAADGGLYGTTYSGGDSGAGTIFKLPPVGALTTLFNFCSSAGFCAAGANPNAGLVQDTNGHFYGTAGSGGAFSAGTVFSLSVGLGPFVETRPSSGTAGELVGILGSDLTGATSVSFNGTATTFTVVSRYLITTTVPPGATTGRVQVVTPGRTLSSNVSFRVP